MTILKVGEVRRVFHEQGVKRITKKALVGLDAAVSRAISDLAGDVSKVYEGQLIERDDLVRMMGIEKDYTIVVRQADEEEEEISIESIIEEEPLEEGEDEEEG